MDETRHKRDSNQSRLWITLVDKNRSILPDRLRLVIQPSGIALEKVAFHVRLQTEATPPYEHFLMLPANEADPDHAVSAVNMPDNVNPCCHSTNET